MLYVKHGPQILIFACVWFGVLGAAWSNLALQPRLLCQCAMTRVGWWAGRAYVVLVGVEA